jgi:hypothetical protein
MTFGMSVIYVAGEWSKKDEQLVSAALQKTSRRSGYVLLGKSVATLTEFMVGLGAEKYRGKQIFDCLMHGAASVNEFHHVRLIVCSSMLAKSPHDKIHRFMVT